jgi:arsenite methyltransferase
VKNKGAGFDRKGIQKHVREHYAAVAKRESSCCGPLECGSGVDVEKFGNMIGYSEKELRAAPEGANMSLGCGNPVALATLKKGEIVLDLGSGGGFDCFLAARKVGKGGRVIGVDMTPEMVEKARENARKGSYGNVEFRLGEIENLPVADGTVDVVISNCVINLSPDKARTFQEAYRVLKPGGRLMVSDVVLKRELPTQLKNSIVAYTGCIAGAMMRDKYLGTIKDAGFRDVEILGETRFPMEMVVSQPTIKAVIKELKLSPENLKELVEFGASIKVRGIKPICRGL